MAPAITIAVGGRTVEIEYAMVGESSHGAPWLVFLHEGLGSVAAWRDFPDRLCRACGVHGLVYSRPGYGKSTPRPADEHWAPDFMQEQATAVLPRLLDEVGAPARYHLLGHSDGGSIALIHAATFPERVASLVALSPHVFVEQLSIDSIEAARHAYLTTDLRQRLARYHADVDSAFWGWNDVWLSAAFRDWTITPTLKSIRCPVLAIQGRQDQYGTMAQVEAIAGALGSKRCQVLQLDHCGHSAQRDQPEAVIAAVKVFLADPVHPRVAVRAGA